MTAKLLSDGEPDYLLPKGGSCEVVVEGGRRYILVDAQDGFFVQRISGDLEGVYRWQDHGRFQLETGAVLAYP